MPKLDGLRRIDQRPSTSGIAGGTVTNASSTGTNDTPLVRRDGTHSLYNTARWMWEIGAEVAGTLRTRSANVLQVFGRLIAGRENGPHVGLQETSLGATRAYVLQGLDAEGVPFFSVNTLDDANPDSSWANIGRAGLPRIHFETVAGYNRQIPIVDAELISGTLDISNINLNDLANNFKLKIVDALAGLSLAEGQPFYLRKGVDSGALYIWSRWGPEPIGGYHAAGVHDHATDDEGGLLLQTSTGFPAGVMTGDFIRYDAVDGRWEVATEPVVLKGLVLTPALASLIDAEGAIYYNSANKSVLVCTEI
jgi:hypothetical protein